MKRSLLSGVVVLTLAFSSAAQQPTPGDQFYQAIRTNDIQALRTLVSAHGANVQDAIGMTPLMLASAFGTYDEVKLLVDAGADVKAASKAGVTPLHVAWRDEAIVRLLLAHGADVQAKSQIGSTPLVVAAYATGTEKVVKLLLDGGADPNAAENRGVTPLIAAAGVGNTAVAKLLLERGANANAYAPGVGQKTATPLLGAAHNGDVELTRLLLARKPDLDTKSPDNDGIVKNGPVAFGALTALHLATAAPSADVVKMLLDAGAAADARDARGATPLMWAIATDRPEPGIIRMLLAKGADPSAVSKVGEDALVWARKYNNSTVLAALKVTSAKADGGAGDTSSVRGERSSQDAVERSLPILHTAASRVMSDGGCVACHAQPMSGTAAELAMRRGWRVAPPSTEITQITVALNVSTPAFLQGVESGGQPDSHLYELFMLATMKTPPTLATDAWVYYLAAKQRPAGHWHSITTRPPIQDGDINRTAMAVRALAVYGTPARKAEFTARIGRAAAWLAAQTPVSTEERIMQLLGLSWAGAQRPLRETRTRELLALQRADGGWPQTPYLASDAYATGQVLYTLHELGVRASDPAVQRGVAYLLRTQAEDGTWHVKSRAMKIQPYFESGFPYGDDQWISQTATAWAAMALTVTDSQNPPHTPLLRSQR
jgi:ankyrin repeat protein